MVVAEPGGEACITLADASLPTASPLGQLAKCGTGLSERANLRVPTTGDGLPGIRGAFKGPPIPAAGMAACVALLSTVF